MTKKHFVKLAAALSEARPDKSDAAAYDRWLRLAGRVAAMCADTNQNFNPRRFIDACEA